MLTTIDIGTNEEQPFILLPAFVNGRGPFSFVLDTGTNAGIITTEELAETLALQNIETREAVGAGGARICVLVGEAGSVSIGTATAENVKVGILKALPRCIGQGIVGYGFLKDYVVTIDYCHGKLRLISSDEHTAIGPGLHPWLPLQIPRPDRPLILVDVLVNSRKPYKFILDTGASGSVVSPTLAKEVGMRSTTGEELIGAAGTVTSSSGTLDALQIGNFVLEEISVMIADAFSPLNQSMGTVVDGILGYNVLRKFELVIDYPNGRLCFLKPGSDQDAGRRGFCGEAIFAQD